MVYRNVRILLSCLLRRVSPWIHTYHDIWIGMAAWPMLAAHSLDLLFLKFVWAAGSWKHHMVLYYLKCLQHFKYVLVIWSVDFSLKMSENLSQVSLLV